MDYSLKIIKKFLSKIRKQNSIQCDKVLYDYGIILSLQCLHRASSLFGVYSNSWLEILDFLLKNYWYKKFDEFCIANNIKEDVNEYLKTYNVTTIQNALDTYYGVDIFHKWESFTNLSVLFGMKNFKDIYFLWHQQVLSKIKYRIKI